MTAAQMPDARFVAFDANGNPLVGGLVHTYVPGGTTPATTWQDAAQTIANSNPITLDAAGSALIYGNGSYQLTVTDAAGNAIPAYSGVSQSIGITSAMQAVVTQATTTGALTLLGGVGVVASIAALRLLTSGPAIVVVEGYAAQGDGGGGTFVYVSSDTTSTDNTGLIVVDAAARRWYRDTQGRPLLLQWFGGGPAAANNVAAWNLAVAAGGNATRIHFPRGSYTFVTSAVLALSSTASVTLTGDGPELTKLLFTTGGFAITLVSQNNSVHVRDMSLLAGGANSGTALTIAQTAAGVTNPANSALSDIANVTIRGSDGLAQTNYFTVGVTINGASNFNFDNLFVTGALTHTAGYGVFLFGTAAITPVLFNFVGCVFNYLNVGINYGSYVQGVSVSQCNFTYDQYGIYCPAALINLAQLAITESQFNCFLYGVLTQSNPAGFSISDNFILVPNNGVGLRHEQAGLFNITGNTFFALGSTGTTGIQIATSTGFGVITGNAFVALATRAISLEATSSNVNVQSNSYQACGANVVNAGTANTVGGGSA
jgi:hypothetical protein